MQQNFKCEICKGANLRKIEPDIVIYLSAFTVLKKSNQFARSLAFSNKIVLMTYVTFKDETYF